jgi:hypothetical protein
MDTMKLGTKQGSEGQIRAQREGEFMDNSINQVQKFTKTLNPKPHEICSGLCLSTLLVLLLLLNPSHFRSFGTYSHKYKNMIKCFLFHIWLVAHIWLNLP